MKILVWTGKYEQRYWDASTPAREAWALRQLFEACHDMGYYEGETDPDLARAAAGDDRALRRLLLGRQTYEYEGWTFAVVETPPGPDPSDPTE